MSTDARKLESLIAGAWHKGVGCRNPDACPNVHRPTSAERAAARVVLDALTAAGWTLLPPRTESRTEWGVWYPGDKDTPRWQFGSTPDAEQAAREHVADGYGEERGLRVVSRTVHETRWTPGEPTDGNPTPTTTGGAQT